MTPRRLTFQLTPLLDLLLIVIFAQYMEVQQKAESAQIELQEKKQELTEQLDSQREELRKELAEQKAKLDSQFAANQEDLQATRKRYSEHYESILKQHQQAGTAIAEALNLPGSLMEQIVRLREDGSPDEANNLQAAVTRMQDMLKSRDSQMMEFILRYDEMQKHVSVWELYVQDNGQAVFSDGEHTQLVSYAGIDEFVSRSFEVSKGFTEPKPLVIILLSYGSPHAVQRQRATNGMPLLIERLRRDSGNTRWFDFSLMGYQAEGPVLEQSAE